jgi:hypothetical protein
MTYSTSQHTVLPMLLWTVAVHVQIGVGFISLAVTTLVVSSELRLCVQTFLVVACASHTC